MTEPLKIGIAGLGTVGGGLLTLLATHGAWLSEVAGRPIEVTGVAAKSQAEQVGPVASKAKWFADPIALARDPSNSVFVELIGGAEGIARACVEAALNAGKHVVTANKALLAHHGYELAKLAESKGVALNFEAAVAGGIPVIKTLRESLGANDVPRVYGILNGTCNYILTKMQSEKCSFEDVLKEAQAKGYAEADPTFDIGGFDAAHKLAILTSLAFSTRVALDQIHMRASRASPPPTSKPPTALAIASSCWVLRRKPRTEFWPGSHRLSSIKIPPLPKFLASPTRWHSMAISQARFCSSARALAVGRRRPRLPATSSISRAATSCRRSSSNPNT